MRKIINSEELHKDIAKKLNKEGFLGIPPEVVEFSSVELEKDRRIKFIRLEMRDFDNPIFKDFSWNEKIVYWVIWFRCGFSTNETNTLNETIANDSILPVRTVENIIHRLLKKKVLTKRTSKSGRRYLKFLINLSE